MPKTGDQITNLDAELDALSSPSTADTYDVTKDYDPDVVAASAVRRAGGGGASFPAEWTVGDQGTLAIVADGTDPPFQVGHVGEPVIFQINDSGQVLCDTSLTGASFVVRAADNDPDTFDPFTVNSSAVNVKLSSYNQTVFTIYADAANSLDKKVLLAGWNHTEEIILGYDTGRVGFYGTPGVVKPTGVAVTAAGIHAALVSLGLIAA